MYNLDSVEANKTNEYKFGIKQVPVYNNVYFNLINDVKAKLGENIYPGSACIARKLLPQGYPMHLCEWHKTEYQHLQQNIKGRTVNIYNNNGLEKILQLSPPPLKRGVVFIDPSYEVKSEYSDVLNFIKLLHKKWSVAVIVVWYPVLNLKENTVFINNLENTSFNKKTISYVNFTNIKNLKLAPNNKTLGSKMFVINTPYGFSQYDNEINRIIN